MANRTPNFNVLLQVGISILVGLLVLAGFFFNDPNGLNLSVLTQLLSTWTTTIIAFALLLGLINVVRVHVSRIVALGEGWLYSTVLVGSALAVVLVGLLRGGAAGDPAVQWLFQYLYEPIAASLSALLVFFLISAAFRTLRAGPSAAWVMLAVALVIMLGSVSWAQVAPLTVLYSLKEWLMSYPVMAGIRGIVLGAALGAAATSLRVIMGIDRPSA